MPEEVMVERLVRIQALLSQQQDKINQQSIGRAYSVLFEREGKHLGQILGKNEFGQPVCVLGNAEHIGKILPVKVNRVVATTLIGEFI